MLADRSATGVLQLLGRLHDQGEPVALLIADQWMPQLAGVELLARARELHPKARRLLLMGVMDRASKALSPAMTLGRLDGGRVEPQLHPRARGIVVRRQEAVTLPGWPRSG